MSEYRLGVILAVISAVVFSTAGIFTKGVVTLAWGVIFWRGVSAAGFTFAYLIIAGKFVDEFQRFKWPAVLATILGASGTAAFIASFKYATVANVALIWATAPFFAAFMAWLFLREKPKKKIMIASVITMIGVIIIIQDSLGDWGVLWGNALAFWMVIMVSGMIVVYRVWPDTPAALPAAMSSVVLLPFAFLFLDPFDISARELWILIAFGLIFAIASVTMAEGAIRVPAAEVALLGALEVPLAPVFAYFILAELPSQSTMIGGVIIISAVFWSQWPPSKESN